MAALFQLNKIEKYMTEAPLCDTNSFNQLVWALYHYFASSARERSFIYRSFLSTWPSSNKAQGLAMLKSLSTHSQTFIKTEAYYFLAKIITENPNEDINAQEVFNYLITNFPQNSVYSELYLMWLKQQNLKQNHNQEIKRYIQLANTQKNLSEKQKQHYISKNPMLEL